MTDRVKTGPDKYILLKELKIPRVRTQLPVAMNRNVSSQMMS